MREKTGRSHDLLCAREDFPESLFYLWEWFGEIGRVRGTGFSGAEPIKYSEIEAWCRLTGVRLEHWELKAIVRLDSVFLEMAHGGIG